MLEEQFVAVLDRWIAEVLDRWIAEVHAEAIRLFREAVPVERCIQIAIAIVDARAESRARGLRELVSVKPGHRGEH